MHVKTGLAIKKRAVTTESSDDDTSSQEEFYRYPDFGFQNELNFDEQK